ncbi:hypothetical protein H6G65_18785 [Microcystis elabens FACHB-917]|nr:hypothetical protein [Microcystis elabens FACHB-917]
MQIASGDQEIRQALLDEFGDDLASNVQALRSEMALFLDRWGSDDDDSDDDEDAPKRTLPEKKRKKLLDASTWERDQRLVDAGQVLLEMFGDELFEDHNHFRTEVGRALKLQGIRLGAADLKVLYREVSWSEESAPPVIAKVHKPGKQAADPLRGFFEDTIGGKPAIVEYEPDSDLRDTEQVPLLEEGGIEAFIRREVLPYTHDAWIKEEATKIGYEISFTRHFYKPQPLRTLEEISADILAIEKEAEGLLDGLLVGAA